MNSCHYHYQKNQNSPASSEAGQRTLPPALSDVVGKKTSTHLHVVSMCRESNTFQGWLLTHTGIHMTTPALGVPSESHPTLF